MEALQHCTSAMRLIEDVDALAEGLSQHVAGCIVDMAATKLILDTMVPIGTRSH